MITGRHRHKLIDGLVIAMGKPKSEDRAPYDSGDGEGDAEAEPEDPSEGPEGSPEEEAGETSGEEDGEALQCAKDAARAAGMPEMNDAKARSFVEAIRTIAGTK